MIRALYSAASGMSAQQLNIDNIANNLANANTTGYKSRRAQFEDLLYQSMVAPGSLSGQNNIVPVGLQLGLGTRAASNEVSFQQGSFLHTSNPLDLVIQGLGFFQIRQPSGDLAYTRNGSFQLDNTGTIVTSDGYPVQPQITIPAAAQSLNPGAERGTDHYRHFSESRRPQFARFHALCADRCFRRPDCRSARRGGRRRHHPAGLYRTIERQRGR
jgi:flagellar basal-body rod protein FlgG